MHRAVALFIAVLSAFAATASAADFEPPHVSLYGIETKNADKTVFVLDHSGSMIDTFDFLRADVKKQVTELTEHQNFAAIMFSEKVDEVFPKDGAHLAKATKETKKQFMDFVDKVRAAGKNDDLLDTGLLDGTKKAIALKPGVIYLLTDGNFDPKFADDIKKLNADVKAVIHTIAYIKITKEAEAALKQIAKDSGGQYTFVTEKDLGK